MDDAASGPESEAPRTIVRAEPVGAPVPATLFGVADPDLVIERATGYAKALTDVVSKQHLFAQIGDKRHVLVEGWTLLGSMLGVFPIERSTLPEPPDWRERGMERPDGYVAIVEARTRTGELVGRANARCMRDEKSRRRDGGVYERWAQADEYALASMAQTRATSKALRMPLGFIVILAGFNATPAEEMDGNGDAWDQATPAEGPRRQTTRKSAAKKQPAKAKEEKPAPKGDDAPASRATWDEAVEVIGPRGKVIDAYRATFDVKGSVAIKDVTEGKLRRVIDLARKAKEES
jgi:hypothetical protein